MNHDLEAGQFAAAMARYEQVFPELFAEEPAMTPENHVAALQLAAVYAWAGEVERMERLLDLSFTRGRCLRTQALRTRP